MYDPQTVTVLRVIKAAQRLGFSLNEIAELMEVAAHRHSACPVSSRSTAAAKLADIDARIADMTTIRDVVVDAVCGSCDDGTTRTAIAECPIPFPSLANRLGGEVGGHAD